MNREGLFSTPPPSADVAFLAQRFVDGAAQLAALARAYAADADGDKNRAALLDALAGPEGAGNPGGGDSEGGNDNGNGHGGGKLPRVFVAGAGRTGLAARALAMRLMQAGWTAHVAGDATTPALDAGDVLIVFSGSGKTAGPLGFAKTAARVGATLCLVTRAKDSPLAQRADLIVRLPTEAAAAIGDGKEAEDGAVERQGGAPSSDAPPHGLGEPGLLGGLFELAAWAWGDALVQALMRRRGIVADDLRRRHANLE